MPFKEELDRTHKQQIWVPIGMVRCWNAEKGCISPKTKWEGVIMLGLKTDKQDINQTVHRGPTINSILPNLENVKHLHILRIL